ncbi:hypothetical protein GCM10011505_28810 [Tistrella bauzanensis]|uniref:Uncharacterized protein n=1 Tax=Tistrella bauzanensis TaxID=657419 RepID=A0ABQ1IME0_9PROT|nr:hypothetical protein GCM10011505_28810 [Tistrella bauzanensis]
MAVEHRHQPAVIELAAHGEIGQADDAQPLFGQLDQRIQRVRRQGFGQGAAQRRRVQWPGFQLAGGRITMMQAGMTGEIRRAVGPAMGREIGGCRDDAIAETAQTAADQPAVATITAAHHRVEAFLDHLHQSVALVDIQGDIGIGAHEAGDDRHHQHADQGQADPQPAAWHCACLEQIVLGRLDLGEDPPAALQKRLPLGRQGDAAGAAMEQPHAQPVFQPRHRLAHRR